MGARQYSPLLGHFLQVDPVEGGSANDYDYVSADPVNMVDLDGLRQCGNRGRGRCPSGRGGGSSIFTVRYDRNGCANRGRMGNTCRRNVRRCGAGICRGGSLYNSGVGQCARGAVRTTFYINMAARGVAWVGYVQVAGRTAARVIWRFSGIGTAVTAIGGCLSRVLP
jgi:hypothetical protein